MTSLDLLYGVCDTTVTYRSTSTKRGEHTWREVKASGKRLLMPATWKRHFLLNRLTVVQHNLCFNDVKLFWPEWPLVQLFSCRSRALIIYIYRAVLGTQLDCYGNIILTSGHIVKQKCKQKQTKWSRTLLPSWKRFPFLRLHFSDTFLSILNTWFFYDLTFTSYDVSVDISLLWSVRDVSI